MGASKEPNVEKFLKELMQIQRKFSNEQKNAKTKRQGEVRDLLEKSIAKEVLDADK